MVNFICYVLFIIKQRGDYINTNKTTIIQRYTNRLICPKCKYTKQHHKDKTLKFTNLSNQLWCSNCEKFSSRADMDKLKRKMGWCF